MNKFLTLLEGGIIGVALLIIFDHVVGKLASRHTYYRPYRPTYYGPYRPTYRSYSNFRDDKDEEEEEE